jgi:cytochrome c peroxidase
MNFKWLLGSLVIIFIGLSFTEIEQDPIIRTPDQLGKLLFNDPILSIDSSISCASCHKPEFAFADTSALSIGIEGHLTRRNTPSVMNSLSRRLFMWDGRAKSLEDQALLPLEHPGEMGFSRTGAVERLKNNAFYGPAFKKMFDREVDEKLMLGVIAAFQRTLETSDTPNDRWLSDKNPGLTDAQIRGRALFFGKANCIECHFTPDFTADEFRNIGLFDNITFTDAGRFDHTKDSTDIGKFKVPGLRNVAVTGPYMHNGMFKTLQEVIEFYNDPIAVVPMAINIDPEIKPLNLSETEKEDLVQFLISLTDDQFIHLVSRNLTVK